MSDSTAGQFAATGRRKSAVARVILEPGSGQVLINKRSLEDYFPRPDLRQALREPLFAVNASETFNVRITLHGGGVAGQAGAARLGLARALEKWDPQLRTTLKRAGYLTRDPRIKERKKYGQRGARARFQFSKR